MQTTAYNSRIILRNRLLPALLGLVIVMQLLDPSRVWSVLLLGLAGTWLVSYVWVRSLARSLFLRREMRFEWAQVGDLMEERFTLENCGPLPALWVEVNDHSNLPGYHVSRVSDVGANSQRRWVTNGTCERRGLFTLGPTSLSCADPFGLYELTIYYPSSTSIMVMPPVVPLPEIEVAPGGRSGEGRPKPDAPERIVSAAAVREYIPGDSLRHIHWATTARKGQPYIRLFDGTPASDWWICLDLQDAVQAGEGWDSTVEHGIVLAASLADRGLRLGRAIGLASNSTPVIWLAPQHSDSQRSRMLRALALAEPGPFSLAELLERNKASFGQRSSLIIITANHSPSWLDAVITLTRKDITPTILLLDPASFGLSQPVTGLPGLLTTWGISAYLIPRTLLDRPEARPGTQGRWEWRVSATGRAVPLHRPGGSDWRLISG